MHFGASNPAQSGPSDTPEGEFPLSIERFSVEIISGGQVSEYMNSLTRIPAGAEFDNDMDLAAHMRILEPLRNWLEINGALTPGSGVLVRTLPERMRPEVRAEEQTLPGTVVARRELLVVLRGPQTYTQTGM